MRCLLIRRVHPELKIQLINGIYRKVWFLSRISISTLRFLHKWVDRNFSHRIRLYTIKKAFELILLSPYLPPQRKSRRAIFHNHVSRPEVNIHMTHPRHRSYKYINNLTSRILLEIQTRNHHIWALQIDLVLVKYP